jgi:CheY-like chemotaxis protein
MDNEEIMQDTLRGMLENFGYTVSVTENGNDAIDFLLTEVKAQRKIAAIILDLSIPGGMGGDVAIGEIRKITTTTPVFVMSGYSKDPMMMHPAEYGFTGSFPKPFRAEELAIAFNKYLAS